ncbi:hypothetical protein D3C71_1878930 [compost metagenome]
MAGLYLKQQLRLPLTEGHFSCTLTQLCKQVYRQVIFTVLLSNAPHQQTQQPLLTIGGHTRSGLQPAQCGIRTFTVSQCHSFRLQRQNVIVSGGDRG